MNPNPSTDEHEDRRPISREDEVSLLDILLVLARNRTLILRVVLLFLLLGGTYAILASNEYTSSAKVVREAQPEGGGLNLPGGISAGALSGLGVNLGSATSGLSPAAFPRVLQSREVRLAVVRDTFRFPEFRRPMTFVEYANRPPNALGLISKYTLRLPFTIVEALTKEETGQPAPAGTTDTGMPVLPSEEENKALEVISGKVSTSIDEETGLMTISVTAEGPRLAAGLTQSFVSNLTTRVREIRTKKVRRRLQFVKQRFQEAEQELERAEDQLATFLERNQNPTTATLQFRRDRLQRQVSFKEQLYSELQSQLTQTRLDLQRRQPVVTVVETPVPPIESSGPRRLFIIVIGIFVGGVLGIGLAFGKRMVSAQAEMGRQEEVEEIQDKLFPVESWKKSLRKKLRFWAHEG
jgi:uncharacterized protein involved in exopolysaccharide biosynthesis